SLRVVAIFVSSVSPRTGLIIPSRREGSPERLFAPRDGRRQSRNARRRRAFRRHRITQSSAHRFLHGRADPCLFGGSQLLQRKGGRPEGAFVEVRLVAEAQRHVPLFELLNRERQKSRTPRFPAPLPAVRSGVLDSLGKGLL